MSKLLTSAIYKQKSTRRGLFTEGATEKKEVRCTSPLRISPLVVKSPRKKSILKQHSESPRRSRKMAKISSPSKRFQSPDTPSKIRSRRRRLPYSRAKSVTYNVSALRQLDPNLAGSKNYRCTTDAVEQENVKTGLDRVASCETVYAGDHTARKLNLETVRGDGRHPQLTNISSKTLANLLGNDSPVKYDIVDCRYPYEYDGGRINQAVNITTEHELYERYFSPQKQQDDENMATSLYGYPPNDTVLIFHCEFSSERAPKMMKTLREIDRKEHKYPNLKFPELYLLKGGYKELYATFPEHCENGYVPMLSANHQHDLEQFRTVREKSKTWNGRSRGTSLTQQFPQRKKLFQK